MLYMYLTDICHVSRVEINEPNLIRFHTYAEQWPIMQTMGKLLIKVIQLHEVKIYKRQDIVRKEYVIYKVRINDLSGYILQKYHCFV